MAPIFASMELLLQLKIVTKKFSKTNFLTANNVRYVDENHKHQKRGKVNSLIYNKSKSIQILISALNALQKMSQVLSLSMLQNFLFRHCVQCWYILRLLLQQVHTIPKG